MSSGTDIFFYNIWGSGPAIHYNAAVSLINLDQPLAAYQHLEAALAICRMASKRSEGEAPAQNR